MTFADSKPKDTNFIKDTPSPSNSFVEDLIEDDVEETQSNEHSNILKPYNIDEIENPPNSLFKSVNSTLKEDNFLIQDRRKVAEKQRFLNTTEVIKNPVNIRTSSLVNSVNSGSCNNSQNRKELRQLNKARWEELAAPK